MSKVIGRPIRRGFTMIELLTVIGIIVILMSILVPVISQIRKQAQNTDTTHFIVKIATACQSYYQDFRGYPGPLPDFALHGFPDPVTGMPTNITQDTAGTPSTALATLLNLSAYSNGTAAGITFKDVTSSQNLVLGLLGGLSYNPASSPIAIVYDTALIPKGPQVLNTLAAQQIPSYLDPSKYDLSSDGVGNYASMVPMGSMPAPGSTITPPPVGTYLIPEFMDHFSEAHPIVYLRARAGATFACDIAPGGAAPGVGASLGSEYYSAEMAPYCPNFFSQSDRYNNYSTLYPPNPNGPSNGYGLLFFQNQALNNSSSGTQNATARGQDSFILISAGYDGLYGTKDDIVYPSN